jgi:hypothetical protein
MQKRKVRAECQLLKMLFVAIFSSYRANEFDKLKLFKWNVKAYQFLWFDFQKVLREWVYMEAVFPACLCSSGMS